MMLTLRKKICLDGIWQMAQDPDNIGRREGWYNAIPEDKSVLGNVPAALEMTFPNYDGVVWYWRYMDIPLLCGQQVILHIGAAEYFCEIWINSQFAGKHEGGNAPAVLNITGHVKQGSNLLSIRLISPSDTPIDGFERRLVPHSCRVCNWQGSDGRIRNWGGIWQSVNLVIVPDIYISDVFANPCWRDGCVTADITVSNMTDHMSDGKLTVCVAAEQGNCNVACQTIEVVSYPGTTHNVLRIDIPDAREWTPDDPWLYRMKVVWNSSGNSDEISVCFGLRELSFSDGYFKLNGKRFFIRSTHQVGTFPGSICRPWNKELLYQDILCLKQAGFNMMRALGYTPLPEQLDIADRLGMLIYQETPASWCMEESPEAPDRWKSNVKEMILRDRNHASVVIWGLFNETIWWDKDGEMIDYAIKSLHELRELDMSRIILLDSGRKIAVLSFRDHIRPGIGEYSLPGTTEWMEDVADAHFYYRWPLADEDLPMSKIAQHSYRGINVGGRKVFYSEFGHGSPLDPFVALRKFDEYGIGKANEDRGLYENMSKKFINDWEQLNMAEVFSTPGHLIREGLQIHARKVSDIFRYIQANPDQIGTSYTGLFDEGGTGTGIFTCWRDAKPSAEAIHEAQKPLRWSLFAVPSNLYRGSDVRIEALLRNEDILVPGSYSARLLINGPDGIVWQKDFDVVIPPFEVGKQEVEQIVFPVCDEKIKFDYEPGEYEVYIYLLDGGDAQACEKLYVTDAAALPKITVEVMQIGLPGSAVKWLGAHGVKALPFDPALKNLPLLIYNVMDLQDAIAQFRLVMEFAESGGTMVCLEPVGANYAVGASGTMNDTVGEPLLPEHYHKLETIIKMLPGAEKAELSWDSRNWYVSTEHYVRNHPVFEELPVRCLMADGVYELVYPVGTLKGLEDWNEITGAFSLGALGGEWGYWHSSDLAFIEYGKGKIVLCMYRLTEILHIDPTAGRLMLNLIKWILSGY